MSQNRNDSTSRELIKTEMLEILQAYLKDAMPSGNQTELLNVFDSWIEKFYNSPTDHVKYDDAQGFALSEELWKQRDERDLRTNHTLRSEFLETFKAASKTYAYQVNNQKSPLDRLKEALTKFKTFADTYKANNPLEQQKLFGDDEENVDTFLKGIVTDDFINETVRLASDRQKAQAEENKQRQQQIEAQEALKKQQRDEQTAIEKKRQEAVAEKALQKDKQNKAWEALGDYSRRKRLIEHHIKVIMNQYIQATYPETEQMRVFNKMLDKALDAYFTAHKNTLTKEIDSITLTKEIDSQRFNTAIKRMDQYYLPGKKPTSQELKDALAENISTLSTNPDYRDNLDQKDLVQTILELKVEFHLFDKNKMPVVESKTTVVEAQEQIEQNKESMRKDRERFALNALQAIKQHLNSDDSSQIEKKDKQLMLSLCKKAETEMRWQECLFRIAKIAADKINNASNIKTVAGYSVILQTFDNEFDRPVEMKFRNQQKFNFNDNSLFVTNKEGQIKNEYLRGFTSKALLQIQTINDLLSANMPRIKPDFKNQALVRDCYVYRLYQASQTILWGTQNITELYNDLMLHIAGLLGITKQRFKESTAGKNIAPDQLDEAYLKYTRDFIQTKFKNEKSLYEARAKVVEFVMLEKPQQSDTETEGEHRAPHH